MPSAALRASCNATVRSQSRWSVVAEVLREAAAAASRPKGSRRRSRGSARGARSRTAPAPRRPPPRAWAAWVVSLLLVSQPCRRRRPSCAQGPATWARRARCRRGCRRRRRNPDVSVLAPPSMLLLSSLWQLVCAAQAKCVRGAQKDCPGSSRTAQTNRSVRCRAVQDSRARAADFAKTRLPLRASCAASDIRDTAAKHWPRSQQLSSHVADSRGRRSDAALRRVPQPCSTASPWSSTSSA